MTYSKAASKGTGRLEGLKPCPVHEPEAYQQYLEEEANVNPSNAKSI